MKIKPSNNELLEKIMRLELEAEHYKKQQVFLNSIYQNVDSAIFVIDIEEGGVFRYSENNNVHQKSLGILSESFIGKTPDDLAPFVPGEIINEVKQNYKRCLDKGKTIEYEEKIIINNQEIWAITRLIPLKNKAGQIYRIIGVSNEISERKEAECALKESEKRYRELFINSKSGIANL